MRARFFLSSALSTSLALAVVLPTMTGCPPACLEGCCDPDCGGDPPSTQVACVDAAPPDGGATAAIAVGKLDGAELVAFADGESRQIDYASGDQGGGGQHFYLTVRAYGAAEEWLVNMRYTSASGNSGAETHVVEQTCDGWYQADTFVRLAEASDEDGTLTVQLGTCPADGCPVEGDAYVLAEVFAETEIGIHLEP